MHCLQQEGLRGSQPFAALKRENFDVGAAILVFFFD